MKLQLLLLLVAYLGPEKAAGESPSAAFIHHYRHPTHHANRHQVLTVLSSSSATSILPPVSLTDRSSRSRQLSPPITDKKEEQTQVDQLNVPEHPHQVLAATTAHPTEEDSHWTRAERRLEALAMKAQATSNKYASEIAQLRGIKVDDNKSSPSDVFQAPQMRLVAFADAAVATENAKRTAAPATGSPTVDTRARIAPSKKASVSILSPELETVKTNLIWTGLGLVAGLVVVQPSLLVDLAYQINNNAQAMSASLDSMDLDLSTKFQDILNVFL